MKNIEFRKGEIPCLVSVTCDKCKKIYDDQLELQEFLCIDTIAGYGSVFGDGFDVELDLCQYCVKEILGPYLRII